MGSGGGGGGPWSPEHIYQEIVGCGLSSAARQRGIFSLKKSQEQLLKSTNVPRANGIFFNFFMGSQAFSFAKIVK